MSDGVSSDCANLTQNEYDPSEIPTVDSIYTFLHTIFTAERVMDP